MESFGIILVKLQLARLRSSDPLNIINFLERDMIALSSVISLIHVAPSGKREMRERSLPVCQCLPEESSDSQHISNRELVLREREDDKESCWKL